MCFFYKPPQDKDALKTRFGIENIDTPPHAFTNCNDVIYNGFTHPPMPIISNESPDKIQYFEWGLLPQWAKEKSFQKNTLNARFESLSEKSSFKNILQNRCLVPAEAFIEWQWQDKKGKEKIKYLLEIDKSSIFAFAGLWSKWRDLENDIIIPTFTIITTTANELMANIHNTKQRMPIILHPESEKDWLVSGQIKMWNDHLQATPLDKKNIDEMKSLF